MGLRFIDSPGDHPGVISGPNGTAIKRAGFRDDPFNVLSSADFRNQAFEIVRGYVAVPGVNIVQTYTSGLRHRLEESPQVFNSAVRTHVDLARRAIYDVGKEGEVDLVVALGPHGDAYKPGTVTVDNAARFHDMQLRALDSARSEVDAVLFEVFNRFYDALGAVIAARARGFKAIVSFVTDGVGRLFDGGYLTHVINQIDNQTDKYPLGYGLNCAPLASVSTVLESAAPGAKSRILLAYPNASSIDPRVVNESSTKIERADPDGRSRGKDLRKLAIDHGLWAVGGCCGTEGGYIRPDGESGDYFQDVVAGILDDSNVGGQQFTMRI